MTSLCPWPMVLYSRSSLLVPRADFRSRGRSRASHRENENRLDVCSLATDRLISSYVDFNKRVLVSSLIANLRVHTNVILFGHGGGPEGLMISGVGGGLKMMISFL